MVLIRPFSSVVLGSQLSIFFAKVISGFLFVGSSEGNGWYVIFDLLLMILSNF